MCLEILRANCEALLHRLTLTLDWELHSPAQSITITLPGPKVHLIHHFYCEFSFIPEENTLTSKASMSTFTYPLTDSLAVAPLSRLQALF